MLFVSVREGFVQRVGGEQTPVASKKVGQSDSKLPRRPVGYRSYIPNKKKTYDYDPKPLICATLNYKTPLHTKTVLHKERKRNCS